MVIITVGGYPRRQVASQISTSLLAPPAHDEAQKSWAQGRKSHQLTPGRWNKGTVHHRQLHHICQGPLT